MEIINAVSDKVYRDIATEMANHLNARMSKLPRHSYSLIYKNLFLKMHRNMFIPRIIETD